MFNGAGKFIAFEGIDGVGKTTQVELLAQHLQRAGVDVLTTREPGGTNVAEELRNILLSTKNENLDALTELLILAAARRTHIQNKIIPALNNNKCVICDRFSMATYAYQGGGRGLNFETIDAINSLVTADCTPHLVIYFQTKDFKRGIKRAREASGKFDRFEAEDLNFFQNVYDAYETMVTSKAVANLVSINADRDITSVHNDVLAALANLR